MRFTEKKPEQGGLYWAFRHFCPEEVTVVEVRYYGGFDCRLAVYEHDSYTAEHPSHFMWGDRLPKPAIEGVPYVPEYRREP